MFQLESSRCPSCTLCYKPAELMCLRCLAHYCSVRCQADDWPHHKLHCIPMPSLVPMNMLMGNLNLPNQTLQTPHGQIKMKQSLMPSPEKTNEATKGVFTKPPEPAVSKSTSLVEPSSVSASEDEAKSSTTYEPKYWLQSRALATDKPFEIIVHFVGDDNLFWVIESGWVRACNKLLRETNKHCLSKQAAKALPLDVALNNVFAVDFEGTFYRAIVIKILNGGQVNVRLIDYGNEFVVQTNALLQPIPIMKNLAPYVVKARLQGVKAVQVEARHVVTVVRQDPTTGVYELQVVKQKCPDLFDLLVTNDTLTAEHGKFTILALPKKTLALGILYAEPLKGVLQLLLRELPKKCENYALCTSVAIGDIVCCQLTDKTWSRVKVMHKFADNYVVFGLDSGCFLFVTGAGRFKACPDELAQMPALSVLVEFTKVMVNNTIFYKSHCFPSADLRITMRVYDGEKREIVATVVGEVGKLAEAKIRLYDGTLESLGLAIWKTVAPANTEIMITEVVNEQALYVCPVFKCGIYHELFQAFAGAIPTYTKTPEPGEYVLATSKAGFVYRGMVQKIITAEDAMQVIDLDSGVVEVLNFKHMSPATDFIKALPVHTMLVKVAGVHEFSVENRMLVAEYWRAVAVKKKTLILSYTGVYQTGVKFLNTFSGAHFMVDVYDFQLAKDMGRLMLKDLVVRELPVGNNVKVSLVDVTNIDEGKLTVVEYHKDNLLLYDQITKAVNDYGKSRATGDAYHPKKDELCIAIFPTDNAWYRAVAVSGTCFDNLTAKLRFIDYGNEVTIDCRDIRKMIPCLMMKAVAHTVVVEDIELFDLEIMLAQLLRWGEEGVFVAKRIEKQNNAFVMSLPEL